MTKKNNIIQLDHVRKIKNLENEDLAYKDRIYRMDKFELLEEMIKFQEERTSKNELSPQMMIRGKILFKSLEENAETEELKILSKSYRRHLEFELHELSKKSVTPGLIRPFGALAEESDPSLQES